MDVLKYKSGDKALIEVNVFDILLDHPDGTMCFVESTDGRNRKSCLNPNGWFKKLEDGKIDIAGALKSLNEKEE